MLELLDAVLRMLRLDDNVQIKVGDETVVGGVTGVLVGGVTGVLVGCGKLDGALEGMSVGGSADRVSAAIAAAVEVACVLPALALRLLTHNATMSAITIKVASATPHNGMRTVGRGGSSFSLTGSG